MYLPFVIIPLLYALSIRGSPINKESVNHPGFKKLSSFKRAILESDDANTLDKIFIVNEAHDKQDLFEGDIALSSNDHVDTSEHGDTDGKPSSAHKRNAQRARNGLWRGRRVPYTFSAEISASDQESFRAAVTEFNSHSCLKWVPKTDEKNWVVIVNKGGCYSSVGMLYWREGGQDLSLGSGCYSVGTIMHEMLHASGFWHEQSRTDRNQYVEVMWENIDDGKAHNFNKYYHESLDMLGKPYDYDSIMHYGKYGFSKNNKPTLQAVGDPNKNFGQRSGFSANDILELNILYDCATPTGGWSSWGSYGPCDSSCHKYRQRFCTNTNLTECPGVNMYGIETDMVQCPQAECNAPVDGHWGRWASWGSCSKTCGNGIHTRTRLCDDPAPKNGGKACEGTSTQSQVCKARTCGLGPDDCEFDANGWCFWTQDSSDTSPTPWIRNQGTTSSSDTGPSGDHTSGSGYYIYAETSSPVAQGQTARLLSKDFPATSGRCISFWYHMYGAGTGALNVLVKNAAGETKIFGLTGDQGNSWKQEKAIIPAQSGTYKIVLESVRGADYRGDTALDDIKFMSCGVPVATEAPTTAVVTVQPDETCDFGTSAPTLCLWRNDKNNTPTNDGVYNFNWFSHNGPTGSANTGPPSGRGGSGYYIYLETSSPFQPGMKGRLLSREFSPSDNMCLEFWYNMYGSSVGALTVYIKTAEQEQAVWSREGDQGQNWIQAKGIIASKVAFKIVFEGTRGSSYTGDIALDDVKVSFTTCT
ncbi:MAM and LDL-receptor class A domain-containing protein 2-like isoform X2 [Nematostella vectensis]|uniref:MAM and LDL-receptor class A domain-containing protein 2-like isoform X2 n=1 Tax=Nematostella vectensis TaxID=45351 RepID=UPI0020774E61|nr:MAM and LDL-receptor class A domain-containing protein 2-like isoform X2 [Nematostella vectensis]